MGLVYMTYLSQVCLVGHAQCYHNWFTLCLGTAKVLPLSCTSSAFPFSLSYVIHLPCAVPCASPLFSFSSCYCATHPSPCSFHYPKTSRPDFHLLFWILSTCHVQPVGPACIPAPDTGSTLPRIAPSPLTRPILGVGSSQPGLSQGVQWHLSHSVIPSPLLPFLSLFQSFSESLIN